MIYNCAIVCKVYRIFSIYEGFIKKNANKFASLHQNRYLCALKGQIIINLEIIQFLL